MKRHSVLVLMVVVALLAAACGTPTAAPPTAKPATAVPPTAVPAQPFKIAVVMPSAINDVAFSQSMYQALKAIQTEMGGE